MVRSKRTNNAHYTGRQVEVNVDDVAGTELELVDKRSVNVLNPTKDGQPSFKKRKSLSTEILDERVIRHRNDGPSRYRDKPCFDLQSRRVRTLAQEAATVPICPNEDISIRSLSIDDYEDNQKPCYRDETFLRSPTFRHTSANEAIQNNSPCGVECFHPAQKNVYLWQRSMAWIDDDDEEAYSTRISTDFDQYFVVPGRSGRESADHTFSIMNKPTTDRGISRRPLLETPSYEVDSDKVTQIHWEEKVVDAICLKRFSNLKL